MLTTQVIYCADNLQKLRELPAESVDLVYIDPSFEISVEVNASEESGSFAASWYSGSKINQYVELMRPRLVAIREVLKERGSLYYQCDWRIDAYVRVMLRHFRAEKLALTHNMAQGGN